MKLTQNAYLYEIKNRFTFHPPGTPEQIANHEIINAVFIDAAVKIAQMCPQSEELDAAINSLSVARAMANASLAIHVNSDYTDINDVELATNEEVELGAVPSKGVSGKLGPSGTQSVPTNTSIKSKDGSQ